MRETLCAIKLLLSTEDATAAVQSGESSISLSSPVIQALQKVRWGAAAQGGHAAGRAAVVVCARLPVTCARRAGSMRRRVWGKWRVAGAHSASLDATHPQS